MRPYFPGGTFNALAPARKGSNPPTPNVHRLLPGLPGYLIPFAPLAFVPQRQELSRDLAFATGLPHDIYAFHCYTVNSRSPLQSSSTAVSGAVSELSSEISHLTCLAAYAPFTPNESEQRLRPLYYRGCWHRVSRLFLLRYYQARSYWLCSRMTGVYNPKAFILHAASLHQGFPHCEKFSTAATRRCLDRVSVPVWLVVLSDQLPVIALVGRYPTN